tara:strand:+ start:6868 stop:7677 length:810 start_codon:yes stop_codon:yes gene_type:complete
MKKILVPTDFYPVADNAIKYAIEIAAGFQSELYLYHVYSFNKFNYDWDFPKDKQPYTKKVERRMKRTRFKFMKKIKEKGLSIQTLVEEDGFFSLFKTKVIEHGVDMIVMGSKGASGLEKIVFGSIAATALEMAKVPVLVVPPEHTFRQLGNIVLAIDHRKVPPNVLLPLQKLAFKFGAKVTILNVYTHPNKNADRISDLHLDGIVTAYREVPMSKSINETINKFIEKEGCDLLCMLRREKGFFERVFQKSITKTQVFSNNVPLLVLPEV